MAASIPAYDALRIFADNSTPEYQRPPQRPELGGADQIYGANVDGEVSVKVSDFPLDDADVDVSSCGFRCRREQIVRVAANFDASRQISRARRCPSCRSRRR